MTKLIVAMILAGLIAAGYLLYVQYQPASESAVGSGNSSGQFQTPSDAIEGARGAVQDTQDLQNKINSKAQEQLNQ